MVWLAMFVAILALLRMTERGQRQLVELVQAARAIVVRRSGAGDGRRYSI